MEEAIATYLNFKMIGDIVGGILGVIAAIAFIIWLCRN